MTDVGYIGGPEDDDPDELAAEAIAYLQANIPGWIPNDNNLEIWLITAISRMVAEAKSVATRVPKAIFRWYGTTLLGIPPIAAARATAPTTWTMVDDQGYTIEAGTVVAYRLTGDTLAFFEVVSEVVVAPGDTATDAGEVLVQAVEEGVASNGLVAGAWLLVDAIEWVDTIVSTATSAGGLDEEDEDTYLDRLSEELRLLTPRPILPEDFAILARRVAGVHRATAIDLYDPGDMSYDNERMVTVVVVDADGAAVSAPVKAAVEAELEAMREVNFVVHVEDPSYTVIDVDYTAKAYVGEDLAAVETAVNANLADFLSPAKWGGGGETPPAWRNDPTVRYLEIAEVINRTAGVNYIETLTVEGGVVNVVMPGVAPLPTAGAITGAVT